MHRRLSPGTKQISHILWKNKQTYWKEIPQGQYGRETPQCLGSQENPSQHQRDTTLFIKLVSPSPQRDKETIHLAFRSRNIYPKDTQNTQKFFPANQEIKITFQLESYPIRERGGYLHTSAQSPPSPPLPLIPAPHL